MRYLALFSVLILLFSCNNKKSNSLQQITISETLEIPTSESFNPDRRRVQYIESDSGEYLAIKNKSIPEILLFDIEKKEVAKRIPLFLEGPNGIGLSSGFQLYSKDCLFIASIPPKIFSLNFEGKITSSIPVQNPSNEVNYLGSNNETPFLFSEKNLFGAQPFISNFFNISPNEIESIRHIYSIDFSQITKTVNWAHIYRPTNTWSEGRKSANFSWTDRYDTIIVAPYTDHRLWVISKRTKSVIKYISPQTTFIHNFRTIEGMPAPGDQGIIKDLEADSYEIIQYDKYRDVFYRFFFPGIDWEDFELTPRELYSNKPRIGVMVLDKDLSTIGEYLFEDHQVQNWNYFVGKKGLYVSTNNPIREDFDENVLRYDIIRFEGLEYEE